MEVRAAVAVQAGKRLEVTTVKLDGRKSATLVYLLGAAAASGRSLSAPGMGGR